ncbi:hypothetical protein [Arachidicoccus ginsenosidivorans]|nr:hypothetical protein [Arachidicoccus ginsenosidivorans]
MQGKSAGGQGAKKPQKCTLKEKIRLKKKKFFLEKLAQNFAELKIFY